MRSYASPIFSLFSMSEWDSHSSSFHERARLWGFEQYAPSFPAMRRAEEGAATDALKAAADELVSFVKSVPRKGT